MSPTSAGYDEGENGGHLSMLTYLFGTFLGYDRPAADRNGVNQHCVTCEPLHTFSSPLRSISVPLDE